ncbi:MAG: DNA primase [Pelagimonas sp.]|jgi:DNA primase|nr:DNA primase [Pelagimonas sp.]
MSLPPGFLDELRTRTSLSQVVGRKVMWDNRKSNQGKGDMWSPCPFHHEKTASFHVDDRKGYYYCFGCHAKGDAISFVRETENVSFMEAIEILAQEAGMEVPKRDPKAQEKADRRTQLTEVMELAVKFYKDQLKPASGRAAREYLAGRGLDQDALDRWDLGYAPAGWENLREWLVNKNVPMDLMLAAGLVRKSDKGRAPYDVFRDRIMFPIRDARGRAIAFGGRAMDPNDNAKYLNSPETELFDKSRNLYNIRNARAAAGKGKPLIVAEGYMDVIALSEAGFEAAVAPLGTAVTEHQLQLLWRCSPYPIFMLDGDKAGIRAQDRVIDLALPGIQSGQSVGFVRLDEGQDPDDMLRAGRKAELEERIEEPRPLHIALWHRELNAAPTRTPEQRADLDKRLLAAAGKIPDERVKRNYFEEFKQLKRQQFFTPKYSPEFRSFKRMPKVSASAKNSLLAQGTDERDIDMIRERKIAALSWRYWAAVDFMRESIEMVDFFDERHEQIVSYLLDHASGVDTSEVEDFDVLRAVEFVMNDPFIKAEPAMVLRKGDHYVSVILSENITLLDNKRRDRAWMQELEEDFLEMSEKTLMWQSAQAALIRSQPFSDAEDDAGQYETADNGADVDRDERNAFHDLLAKIGHGGARG